MAKRRRSVGPALYELMKPRRLRRSTVPAEESTAEAPRSTGERGASWLTPGRIVAMPVGYVLLAASIVLLLVCGAYIAGYQRAEDRLHDDYLLARPGQVETAPPARDPLLTDGLAAPAPAASAPPPAPQTPRSVAPAPRAWQPIESDPRRAGLHYFVLATTRKEGALRLAEFCRESGLEAYVLGDNNDRLRRVIALPGFQSRTDPEVSVLEAAIHRVGRMWTEQHRGESSLRDAYLERYNGR